MPHENSGTFPIRQPPPLPFGPLRLEEEKGVIEQLYFQETGHYEAVTARHIHLIVGRRGTGKSSLGEFLRFARYAKDQTSRKYQVYVDIDEPEIFQGVLARITSSINNAQPLQLTDAVAKLWELALWHPIIDAVSRHEGFSEIQGSFKVGAYLKSRSVGGRQASTILRKIIEIILDRLGTRTKTTDGLMREVIKMTEDTNFQSAKRTVENYIKNTRLRVVVVLDTLEEYQIRDPVSQRCLAALITALQNLTQHDAIPPTVDIKCFLPAELFGILEETVIQNLGKVLGNTYFLHWRPKDLLRMMSWRLYYYLTEAHPEYCPVSLRQQRSIDWNDYDDVRNKVWNAVFTRTSRKFKNGAQLDPLAYITRYTQLRPRQVIRLGNEILTRAHRERSSFDATWNNITRGVQTLVKDQAIDILNSFNDIYPNCVNISTSAFSGAFSGDKGYAAYLNYNDIEKIGRRSKDSWTTLTYDRQAFWRLCLETGIVGLALPDRDSNHFRSVQYEYAVQRRLLSTEAEEFAIHPMFHSLFGLDPMDSKNAAFKLQQPLGPDDVSSLREL